MTWRSSKTFGHDIGLTCCFRQWRTQSHCRFLHGYALSFKFTFEANELDVRNWVVDFGSLKSLKAQLESFFDHKTVVAEDDPKMALYHLMEKEGLVQLIVMPSTGCEKFAEYAFRLGEIWLLDNGYSPRVKLVHVEVREHGANGGEFFEGMPTTIEEEDLDFHIPGDVAPVDSMNIGTE